jgi:hypothetical protein
LVQPPWKKEGRGKRRVWRSTSIVEGRRKGMWKRWLSVLG